MRKQKREYGVLWQVSCASLFFLITLLLPVRDSHALPSFARQTGMACNDCHTIFPELTSLGRAFKLGGYTQSMSDKPYEFPPPIAAGMLLSYTGQKGLTNGVAPYDKEHRDTDKTNLPQEFSLFYGGRIYGDLGAFVQGTYDGIEDKIVLDIVDIRLAHSFNTGGAGLTLGITVNNRPSVQDLWNSTPGWGYPYDASGVANGPAAHTLLEGTLESQVGGIGVYALFNDLVYLEGSVYRTARYGVTKPLGAGIPTDTVVKDAAPYWRLALQHQWSEHYLSVGTYGMTANIFPAEEFSGPTDRFTDMALDAEYQFTGTNHIVTATTTWIHEWQKWNAGYDLGSTANRKDTLNSYKANANYYYRSGAGTVGGMLGYFSITGDKDAGMYTAEDEFTGSADGSPNSNGFVAEVVYMPVKYFKVAVQYVDYEKFNGAHTNYDGFGTNASHNNTIFLYTWLML